MPHALDPYPSPEARDAALHSLAARAGGAVRAYGASVEGRSLLVAEVPRNRTGPGEEQRVLVTANIHGVELIAARVALGFLERVATGGELARLRERADIYVIPCLNPDGYARTWEHEGRGTLKELRPNAHGVDLNRNFPLPSGASPSKLPFTGSDRPRDATYRGPSALSEPETRALGRFLDEVDFTASVSCHSFMGTLIPPRVIAPREFEAYRQLCGAFRAAQCHARYRRLASRLFDAFTGELEDFQHHHHRTWAICIESFPLGASIAQHVRAPSLFWRFNPRDPERWIDNDVPGIAAFFEAALARPRPGEQDQPDAP